MKTLLVIFSHSGFNELMLRHWPHYRKAGCDILVVGSTNKHCVHPGNDSGCISVISEGDEPYAKGYNYTHRFLAVLDHCLQWPRFNYYDAFCFIEPDAIFTGRLPGVAPGVLSAKLAGFSQPGFKASKFLHGPWSMDRETAEKILDYGRKMLALGMDERGMLDQWFGLMIDTHGLGFEDYGPRVYSRNLIEMKHVDDAKTSIKSGAIFLHGIKHANVLEAITK